MGSRRLRIEGCKGFMAESPWWMSCILHWGVALQVRMTSVGIGGVKDDHLHSFEIRRTCFTMTGGGMYFGYMSEDVIDS